MVNHGPPRSKNLRGGHNIFEIEFEEKPGLLVNTTRQALQSDIEIKSKNF